MEQTIAIISLVFLIAAIVIGFWRNMNMGILAIAFALILGRMAGLSDSDVLGSFDSSLFLRLLGIMFMLSIVQSNGTIEKLTRKLAALSGSTVKLIPFAMYILFIGVAAAGAGGPAGLAIAAIVTVPIAYQLKISPMMLAPAACWGTFAGTTELSITGILLKTISAEVGISINMVSYFFTALVMQTIVFLVWYVLSGWPRFKTDLSVTYDKGEPMDKANWISLGGLVFMVFLSIVLKVDIGLAGFASAALLILIPGVVDEKKAISGISWGTLVLVGGMGILISTVDAVGGIDLLSDMLSSIMTIGTAPAIVSAMSSLLSLVSSTTGVVMPTFIPTMPGVVEALGGGNAAELAYAVTLGASQTAISPLSTGGALILAAYGNFFKPTSEQRSKLFVQLFGLAAICMASFAVMGLIGLYGIFL